MNLRFPLRCCFAFGFELVAASAPADPETREPRPPIFIDRESPAEIRPANTPPSSAAKPPSSRATSPEMSAKILGVVKGPPAFAKVERPPPPPNARDVVTLRPFIVREPKAPEFKERELLTEKGKAALAHHRYPGADAATARQMLEEDFARERRDEILEMQGLLELDRALPRELRNAMYDARLRR